MAKITSMYGLIWSTQAVPPASLGRRFATSLAVAFGAGLVLMTTIARGQDCPPCQKHEERSVTTAREQLAEAFGMALEVTDCTLSENSARCREIDKLMEDVIGTIDTIFNGHRVETVADCMSCDPRPQLWPLVDGTRALIALLQEKGDTGFTDYRDAFAQKLEVWKRYRCPCSDEGTAADDATRDVKRNREAEARKEIIRKCGEMFANGRRELLQIFRVPNDRQGCYQSRACRSSEVYNGFQTQPGFWTYDGEYWYIWAERRGTGGRWITCER